jgi:signal peptidase II
VKKLKAIYYVIYSAVILGGIGLDQLSKFLAVKLLAPIESVPLWEGVLHLTYVENRGAAFGMLADHRWVFMSISSVAIIAIALYLYSGRNTSKLYTAALMMIVSGGIGNMIDRIALGYVIDFIDFALIDFAVFNIADSIVCIGAGLLILSLVLDIIKEAKAEKEKKASKK